MSNVQETTSIAPDRYELTTIWNHRIRSSSEQPIEAAPSPYHRWSGVVSRVVATLLILPASAVILLAGVLVRLTSPGPAIYRQVRLGLNGQPFVLYKIRTMVAMAEATTGPVWAAKGDPRITPVGSVLRALCLDELPQLFNVIRGDIALVGPRPERPEIAEVLVERIPGYANRLVVRPGITGLAQINLPADDGLDCVRKKLRLDLEYIRSASFWLDARIVLATTPRLIGLQGGHAAHLLRVWRPVPWPEDDTVGLLETAGRNDGSTNGNGFSRRHPQRPR